MTFTDRTTELSEDVLEQVKEGQQAAIKAVRAFTESLDQTLERGESPSQAEEITDSALKMADRLVETQYNFLSKVVRSAGKSVGAPAASETDEAE